MSTSKIPSVCYPPLLCGTKYFVDTNELNRAEDHLRVIRDTVVRAKSLRNFAGLSSIFAGFASIAGAFAQRLIVLGTPAGQRNLAFILNWTIVVAAALVFDYWHTHRRVADADRALAVRLVRHQARAAWPALLSGIALTLAFLGDGRMNLVYPYWMLCYGSAVSAAALGGAKELAWLGRSFLVFGTVLLLVQTYGSQHLRDAQFGLAAMLPTFGLLNISYGIVVGRKAGW